MKVTNAFGMVFSGAIGKSIVASSWKGIQYIRAYAKPSDPKTERQTKVRHDFRRAAKSWQALDDYQQHFYERIAVGISGYNLFMSRFMRAVKNHHKPEFPLIIHWRTGDGLPVEEGMLVVRRNSKTLFADSLEEVEGEIALTPSDTPYTFLLKRGARKETVLTVSDLRETDWPSVLTSRGLGLRVVLDITPGLEVEAGPE
jgi:hypothetical protein